MKHLALAPFYTLGFALGLADDVLGMVLRRNRGNA